MSQASSPESASDRRAAAGVAPFAGEVRKFTVTSFQPTLAAGSDGRK